MPFFKNGEQEGKTGPVWELVWAGRGRGNIKKGYRKPNVVKNIFQKYYENGKMRPVETIPGMGGGGRQENDLGGEFSYDYTVRTFVNVPPVQQ
jgi:hypothetical protein